MIVPALLLALSAGARADVVHLKNGNEMEGVITAETRSKVTLDFGYGSTNLDKADIAKIVRSGKKQASQTAKVLKARRYESGAAVPQGGEKLSTLYRKVQGQREQALAGRARERELDDEAALINERLPDLKAAFGARSVDLQRIDSGADPRGYNRQIGEVNKAAVKIQADGLRLQEIDRLKTEAQGQVHSYLDSYRQLQDYVAGEGKALLSGQADYYAWLRGEIASMAGDFKHDVVPSEKRGDSLFVTVMLNGKVPARLLVDTGASMTFLYKEAADRLALPPEARLGKTRTTVADGREVEAEVVRLDLMSVGKSEVRGSFAAVSPSGGMGFDGLLGMSFLGRFIVRVDAANGRLILDDLKTPAP